MLFKKCILIALMANAVRAQDVFEMSRAPFAGQLATSDIPQFVTITFDDSVTSQVTSLINPIVELTDSKGCGPKATFYVSIEGSNNQCELVQGARKGLHEIATHTLNHIGYPGLDEIQGAKDHLANMCGVPAEEIQGFRAPFLQWNEETLDNLKQLGFTYDSSISPSDEPDANKGRDRIWPFTYTAQSANAFNCGPNCPLTEKPGLWEIPMWMPYDSNDRVSNVMDYSGGSALLDRNFERRYNGNRSPMGIFLHAGWLQSNGSMFKSWIQTIMNDHDDVYFVTSQELLEYMRNPVSKTQYAQIHEQSCVSQVRNCFPPTINNCLYGTFDVDTCSCQCFDNYCKNAAGDCATYSYTGCGPAPTPVAPTPTAPSPTPPTGGSSSECCDAEYSGYVGYENCSKFYQCSFGQVVAGSTITCSSGLVFDSAIGNCNWAASATACSLPACAGSSPVGTPPPTSSPSTAMPTRAPVAAPSGSPSGMPVVPTVMPSSQPSDKASQEPTTAPISPTSSPSTSPSATATATPTSQPVSGAAGCCSMNWKTCDTFWCGEDAASCSNCGSLYRWLPQGERTGCSAKWTACADASDCCGDELVCKWSQCAPP